MSKLKFKDGEEFNTSGPLRTEERFDGLYVVGRGHLIPVKDKAEAEAIIKNLEKKQKNGI